MNLYSLRIFFRYTNYTESKSIAGGVEDLEAANRKGGEDGLELGENPLVLISLSYSFDETLNWDFIRAT